MCPDNLKPPGEPRLIVEIVSSPYLFRKPPKAHREASFKLPQDLTLKFPAKLGLNNDRSEIRVHFSYFLITMRSTAERSNFLQTLSEGI